MKVFFHRKRNRVAMNWTVVIQGTIERNVCSNSECNWLVLQNQNYSALAPQNFEKTFQIWTCLPTFALSSCDIACCSVSRLLAAPRTGIVPGRCLCSSSIDKSLRLDSDDCWNIQNHVKMRSLIAYKCYTGTCACIYPLCSIKKWHWS